MSSTDQQTEQFTPKRQYTKNHFFIKARLQAGMQIHANTNLKNSCWDTSARGPNRQPSKAQMATADQTSNIKRPPLTSANLVRAGQSSPSPSKLILRTMSAAAYCESDRESRVLTERMETANTSGSRLAHVPHLPLVRGAAGVADLKRDRGRSQVGRGQAEVSAPTHGVIKCWN